MRAGKHRRNKGGRDRGAIDWLGRDHSRGRQGGQGGSNKCRDGCGSNESGSMLRGVIVGMAVIIMAVSVIIV